MLSAEEATTACLGLMMTEEKAVNCGPVGLCSAVGSAKTPSEPPPQAANSIVTMVRAEKSAKPRLCPVKPLSLLKDNMHRLI